MDYSEDAVYIGGPICSLLCHDPEPGYPILKLGVSCRSKEQLLGEPKRSSSIEYPFSSKHIYHSQASLEGVHSVECFLGGTEMDGLAQPCVGVILEYANGRRNALGECRVGISKSINILAPTMLHLKPANEEGLHSGAWFTSSEREAEARQSLGWEGRRMGGTLVWWFGLNMIEIIHS